MGGRIKNRVVRQFVKDKTAVVGLLLFLIIVIVSIAAPSLAPHEPSRQSLRHRLTPPGENGYVLGADDYGRDQFSRILYGGRVSLTVGLLSVAFGMVIGIPLGLTGGYFGGRWDAFVVRITDIFMAFPDLVLALVIVTLLGAGVDRLIWAIGFTFIPRFIRLARAAAITLRNRDFIDSARALGASSPYILFRYVFPNSMGQILAMTALFVGIAIRSEASLSFIGLGVQPPLASWGGMLRDGLTFLRRAPFLSIYPGLVIFFTILSLNMMGDGIRDAIDPKTGRQ